MRYKKKLKRAGKAELYLPDEAFLFPFPPPPKKNKEAMGMLRACEQYPETLCSFATQQAIGNKVQDSERSERLYKFRDKHGI